ncbi:hypothetical protein FCL47_21815 [Desulfopila sp. IMCC35006]|uniref:TIGR02186 family protein n=1 Tax=Desulfopila sp. IMCC35006 TaxID=2569542 RepID=UPI0010ACC911|nr:TIGR02186 family protein [Desulfopila sp. IMCC35006]TKB23679.1 hypothetical protein FCL47_21815 [Desulfopila sp. IMCC35006]
MSRDSISYHFVLLVLITPYILAMTSPAATDDSAVTVQPQVITISSFFSGAQMNITSELPPGCQAVLSVSGKKIEEEMMRKSRHWDLWMNTGEIDIYNAPILYLAFSTDPVLLTVGNYPWGYNALEKQAQFVGRLKPIEDATIFKEFIQLKERDKLYQLFPGELKIKQLSPSRWQTQADFHLPSRIKPGSYQVALWVLKDGVVLERRTASFEVKMEGVPAIINAMAKKHGVSYGFLAVGLAMAVGMLTGMLFHRKCSGRD